MIDDLFLVVLIVILLWRSHKKTCRINSIRKHWRVMYWSILHFGGMILIASFAALDKPIPSYAVAIFFTSDIIRWLIDRRGNRENEYKRTPIS